MADERWFTVEEIAEILRVHEQTVRRWLRAGDAVIDVRSHYKIFPTNFEIDHDTPERARCYLEQARDALCAPEPPQCWERAR